MSPMTNDCTLDGLETGEGGAMTGRDFLNLACFDFSCGMDAIGWDGRAIPICTYTLLL
jgi:hypothetical protein